MTGRETIDRLINWRGHGWIALPARLYLGAVFFFACIHKIAHPGAFALDVATYDILPLALINPMAIALPYIELAAGLMLIVGLRARAAAMMVNGMMVMFIVALSIALYKGLDLSCGCFASQEAGHAISTITLLRDLGWLALGLYVMLFDREPIGLDRLLKKKLTG